MHTHQNDTPTKFPFHKRAINYYLLEGVYLFMLSMHDQGYDNPLHRGNYLPAQHFFFII